MKSIDLNCDMGESFGAWVMGNDSELLNFISSANLACGFHAGDPLTMRNTVREAQAHGVAVGAHPGLPDLQGFGRRPMAMTPDEVYALVVYQVGALFGFARACGTRLNHVKTHGALYQMTANDQALADAIADAVHDVDTSLLMTVSSPNMVRAAERVGLRVIHEVYADRTYQADGTLTPRSQPNAMIVDIEQSILQVRRMVHEGVAVALSGERVPVRADSICVHGDQPGAVEFARHLRAGLEADGITIRAP
jgi:UPF0271 protein